MSEFVINDYLLSQECEGIAKDIADEFRAELAEDETLEDVRDEMFDRAHETADGHQWVIYTHQAIMLCAHCDTTAGEEFLEDVGMPETPTFGGLATFIAYGEIRHRIEEELQAIVDDEDEDETEAEDVA